MHEFFLWKRPQKFFRSRWGEFDDRIPGIMFPVVVNDDGSFSHKRKDCSGLDPIPDTGKFLHGSHAPQFASGSVRISSIRANHGEGRLIRRKWRRFRKAIWPVSTLTCDLEWAHCNHYSSLVGWVPSNRPFVTAIGFHCTHTCMSPFSLVRLDVILQVHFRSENWMIGNPALFGNCPNKDNSELLCGWHCNPKQILQTLITLECFLASFGVSSEWKVWTRK